MIVKKAGKHIIGAVLTAAEKKALDMEIMRQIAEFNEKNICEVDAAVLWTLYRHFEWEPEQLRAFYKAFHECMDEVIQHYQMEEADRAFVCTELLREVGVDLVAWDNEK